MLKLWRIRQCHRHSGYTAVQHSISRSLDLLMVTPRVMLLCFFASLCLSSYAKGSVSPQAIDVTRAGDSYIVNVTLSVAVPVKQAWSVLTDFENFSRWIPNVTHSRVMRRARDVAVVEQSGTTKVGPASFSYTTEGSVRLKEPVSIQSTQIKGDMRRLESSVSLRPEGRGTRGGGIVGGFPPYPGERPMGRNPRGNGSACA